MSSIGLGCSAAVRRVSDKVDSTVAVTVRQAIGTSFGTEGRERAEE